MLCYRNHYITFRSSSSLRVKTPLKKTTLKFLLIGLWSSSKQTTSKLSKQPKLQVYLHSLNYLVETGVSIPLSNIAILYNLLWKVPLEFTSTTTYVCSWVLWSSQNKLLKNSPNNQSHLMEIANQKFMRVPINYPVKTELVLFLWHSHTSMYCTFYIHQWVSLIQLSHGK